MLFHSLSPASSAAFSPALPHTWHSRVFHPGSQHLRLPHPVAAMSPRPYPARRGGQPSRNPTPNHFPFSSAAHAIASSRRRRWMWRLPTRHPSRRTSPRSVDTRNADASWTILKSRFLNCSSFNVGVLPPIVEANAPASISGKPPVVNRSRSSPVPAPPNGDGPGSQLFFAYGLQHPVFQQRLRQHLL